MINVVREIRILYTTFVLRANAILQAQGVVASVWVSRDREKTRQAAAPSILWICNTGIHRTRIVAFKWCLQCQGRSHGCSLDPMHSLRSCLYVPLDVRLINYAYSIFGQRLMWMKLVHVRKQTKPISWYIFLKPNNSRVFNIFPSYY